MITSLQDFAFAKHKDNVRVLHRGQTMGNDEHGPALAGPLKCCLNQLLTLRIQARSRFVEKQNLWISNQSPSNRNSLFLPAAQCHTFHSNIRVVALGKGCDKVVDFCITARLMQYFRRGRFLDAEQDIFSDRSLKQSGFLSDKRYDFSVFSYVQLGDVAAVTANCPFLNVIEPRFRLEKSLQESIAILPFKQGYNACLAAT
jgi:hypothetical protein